MAIFKDRPEAFDISQQFIKVFCKHAGCEKSKRLVSLVASKVALRLNVQLKLKSADWDKDDFKMIRQLVEIYLDDHVR